MLTVMQWTKRLHTGIMVIHRLLLILLSLVERVLLVKPTITLLRKVLWFNNVNLINNAKWVYEMFKNVNPRIDLIISSDIMMTSSIQYADVGFPVNSWMEFEQL